MTAAPAVLLAVAAELEKLAKERMPKLRGGEMVVREWYEDGIYFRETTLNGELFKSQFDFRLRKGRRMAATKGDCNA